MAPLPNGLCCRRHADPQCQTKSIIFCEWRTEIDLLDEMFRRNKVRPPSWSWSFGVVV